MISRAYANHMCPEKFLSLFFVEDDDLDSPDIVSFWWQQIQTPEGAAAFLDDSVQEIQTQTIILEQEQEQQKHDNEVFWEEEIQHCLVKLAESAADVAHRYGVGLGDRVDKVSRLSVAQNIDMSWWSYDARIPCVRIPLSTPELVHKFTLWTNLSDVVDDTMLAMVLQDDVLYIGGYQYSDVYSFRDYAQDLDRAVRDALVQCQTG